MALPSGFRIVEDDEKVMDGDHCSTGAGAGTFTPITTRDCFTMTGKQCREKWPAHEFITKRQLPEPPPPPPIFGDCKMKSVFDAMLDPWPEGYPVAARNLSADEFATVWTEEWEGQLKVTIEVIVRF